MKHFITRLAFFLLASFLFLGSVYWLSEIILNLRIKQYLKLKSNIHILFAGDSSIACNINDSLIPNSVNIAFNGESYMYSYCKLNEILAFNPQITTVFINFNNLNFHKSAQDQLLFDELEVHDKNKAFNYLMGFPEKKIIFCRNPVDYIRSLRLSITQNIYRIFISFFPSKYGLNDYDFGGYYFLERDNLEKDKEKLLKQKLIFKKANIQVRYLQKISVLCKENNVKLVLLSTPQHMFYRENMDKNWKEYWAYIKDSVKGDSVLDYSCFELPDSVYSDLGHLNYKGARIFSKCLNDYINKSKREHGK